MNVETERVVEGLGRTSLDTVPPPENARVCLTQQLQAEGHGVLHFCAGAIPDVPWLFLDTAYHFSRKPTIP